MSADPASVTILVIEDDAGIADAIASMLEDHGYGVLVAANGKDGMEKLRAAEPRPDLILLDLMMPVMDGWEFRAAQRSDPKLADVPVVLLSANVDVGPAANELAAVSWLKKPVDLGALLHAVQREP
jgi:CheY-like chemotaxis protein